MGTISHLKPPFQRIKERAEIVFELAFPESRGSQLDPRLPFLGPAPSPQTRQNFMRPHRTQFVRRTRQENQDPPVNIEPLTGSGSVGVGQ